MSQAKDRSIFTITAAHTKTMRRRLLSNLAPATPLLAADLTCGSVNRRTTTVAAIVPPPVAHIFDDDLLYPHFIMGEINIINSPLLMFSPTSPTDMAQFLHSPTASFASSSPGLITANASFEGNSESIASDTCSVIENNS